MTITDIYKKYRINKGLQEHMIRVASVAKIICDNSMKEVDTENIITACLLHDMGNIVKTKFNLFPELFEPEGPEFYKQVQKEVIEKYGADDHGATLAILSELGASDEVIDITEATGLKKIPEVVRNGDIQEKIMMYCDLRVGMLGVITIDERFDDLFNRYVPYRYTQADIETGRKQMNEIESEMFVSIHISPEDITDASTKEIQVDLLKWEVN